MKKNYVKFVIFLVPLILLTITFLVFIPMKQALVFQSQNNEKVLAYIPFSEEQSFKIKYTHSIHLSDVVESYQITEDDQIQQYELMYEDFAIGMPSTAGEGEIFEEKDGKYFIKNMKRVFPSFSLRVGQVVANHTVIYKGNEYPLTNIFEPGSSVQIQAKKLNLLQRLKGVNIIE